MKSLTSYFALALLVLFIGIGLSACNDICKNIDCLNGGTCIDGDCDCPEGYRGENCEEDICAIPCVNGTTVLIANAEACRCECDLGYFGIDCATEQYYAMATSFEVVDECCRTDNGNCFDYNYDLNITYTTYPNYEIVGFARLYTPVTGYLDDYKIIVPQQVVHYQGYSHTVQGTGHITPDGVINLEYSAYYESGVTLTCEAVCTMQ